MTAPCNVGTPDAEAALARIRGRAFATVTEASAILRYDSHGRTVRKGIAEVESRPYALAALGGRIPTAWLLEQACWITGVPLPENSNSPAEPSLSPGRHQTSHAAAAKRWPDAVIVALCPDAAWERPAAWQKAVEHLHAARLPAAVPELAAHQLAPRGVRADWSYAPRRPAPPGSSGDNAR